MHQLAQAALAVRPPDRAVEVLARHDVGRGLRPVGRHLHVRLLEDDVPLHVSDHRRALLPLERVIRRLAVLEVAGEIALEGQAAPDPLRVLGGLRPCGSRHSRLGFHHCIDSCRAHRPTGLLVTFASPTACRFADSLQAIPRTTLAHLLVYVSPSALDIGGCFPKNAALKRFSNKHTALSRLCREHGKPPQITVSLRESGPSATIPPPLREEWCRNFFPRFGAEIQARSQDARVRPRSTARDRARPAPRRCARPRISSLSGRSSRTTPPPTERW